MYFGTQNWKFINIIYTWVVFCFGFVFGVKGSAPLLYTWTESFLQHGLVWGSNYSCYLHTMQQHPFSVLFLNNSVQPPNPSTTSPRCTISNKIFHSLPQFHHCNVGACSSEKKLQASSALKKLCSSIFTTYCAWYAFWNCKQFIDEDSGDSNRCSVMGLQWFSSFKIALESLSEEPSLKSTGNSEAPTKQPLLLLLALKHSYFNWSSDSELGSLLLCSIVVLSSESGIIISSFTETPPLPVFSSSSLDFSSFICKHSNNNIRLVFIQEKKK